MWTTFNKFSLFGHAKRCHRSQQLITAHTHSDRCIFSVWNDPERESERSNAKDIEMEWMRRKMWKCGQFSWCFIFFSGTLSVSCPFVPSIRVELISNDQNPNRWYYIFQIACWFSGVPSLVLIPARWKIRRWFSMCVQLCIYMSSWLMIFTLYFRPAVNTSFLSSSGLFVFSLSLAARRDNCTRSIIGLWLNHTRARTFKQMILPFKWRARAHPCTCFFEIDREEWKTNETSKWKVRMAFKTKVCVRVDALLLSTVWLLSVAAAIMMMETQIGFDIVYIESNNKNPTEISDKIQMSLLLLLYWSTSNKQWKIKLWVNSFNQQNGANEK